MQLKRIASLISILLPVAFATPAIADEFVTQSSNISADVSRADGRIAIDLLGSIWILPAKGGEAILATDGLQQASRPRWSPDGRQILYQTSSAEGTSLWLLDVQTSTTNRVSDQSRNDQFATWHPQGERIIYASGRNDTDFDIWETDLPTGLSWRVSNEPGDEFEPVWSANGRDLAYIRMFEDRYSLVVRRHGRPAATVLTSDEPLSSLSWRPDGTLLTYLHGNGDAMTSEMIILSDPPLIREFAVEEEIFSSPVSWMDRSQHIYTAEGTIRTRAFGERRSKPLPFRAYVPDPDTRPPRVIAQRELGIVNPSQQALVIRGARLFDGIWKNYRNNMDVLIEDGRISAVEPSKDWPGVTILDIGNVTILPGFVDAWSRIPSGTQQHVGLTLLSYGITTIVTDEQIDAFDGNLWEGPDSPGPRMLPALNLAAGSKTDDFDAYYLASISSTRQLPTDARDSVRSVQDRGIPVVADNWNTHVSADADMLLGVDSLPRSSLDSRYQEGRYADSTVTTGQPAVTVISGLADAATPGMNSLLQSRQARELGQSALPTRRHSVLPQLAESSASVLLGSKPNGLPAGMALHAELRALKAAGLSGEQVLHTAGRNPARALGLENQVGTITPGALADMVLVAGDPLQDMEDALKIVAVVRNGRFFSLVRLLEQAATGPNVE